MKLNPGGNAKLVSMGKSLQEEMETLLGPDGVLLYPSHPTIAPRHHSPICMPFNFAYTGEGLRRLCWGAGRARRQGAQACPLPLQQCGVAARGLYPEHFHRRHWAEGHLAAPEHGARITIML